MVFWVLTILTVISGIYCCDLPSFMNRLKVPETLRNQL